MPKNFRNGVVSVVREVEGQFGMLDNQSEEYNSRSVRDLTAGFSVLSAELCKIYGSNVAAVICEFDASTWNVAGSSKKSSYDEDNETIVLKGKPSFITFFNRLARHLGKNEPVVWARDLFAQAFPEKARRLVVSGNALVLPGVASNDCCDDDEECCDEEEDD